MILMMREGAGLIPDVIDHQEPPTGKLDGWPEHGAHLVTVRDKRCDRQSRAAWREGPSVNQSRDLV